MNSSADKGGSVAAVKTAESVGTCEGTKVVFVLLNEMGRRLHMRAHDAEELKAGSSWTRAPAAARANACAARLAVLALERMAALVSGCNAKGSRALQVEAIGQPGD